jgi:Mg2+ and Co2+ transporter CorA
MMLVIAIEAQQVVVETLPQAQLPLKSQELDAICSTPDPLFIARDDVIVMRYPPHTCVVAAGRLFVVCKTEKDKQFSEVLRWHLFGNGGELTSEFGRDVIVSMLKRTTSITVRLSNTVDSARRKSQLASSPPFGTLADAQDAVSLHTQKAVFETIAIFIEKMTDSVLSMEADVQNIIEDVSPARNRILSNQQLRDLKTCKLTVASTRQKCAQLKLQLGDFADNESTPTIKASLSLVGSTNFSRILDELCACLNSFEYSMTEEEEFASIQIDRQRNNLIYVTMVLTASSLSVSFVSMIAGIFGENMMPAAIDTSTSPLWAIVNLSAGAVALCMFGGVMSYCYLQGIRGT